MLDAMLTPGCESVVALNRRLKQTATQSITSLVKWSYYLRVAWVPRRQRDLHIALPQQPVQLDLAQVAPSRHSRDVRDDSDSFASLMCERLRAHRGTLSAFVGRFENMSLQAGRRVCSLSRLYEANLLFAGYVDHHIEPAIGSQDVRLETPLLRLHLLERRGHFTVCRDCRRDYTTVLRFRRLPLGRKT